MGEWIEFFLDNRFGWRFKIANFIMNDYLRNYLAVGCLCPLENLMRSAYNRHPEHVAWEARRMDKTIRDLMEM